MQAHALAEINRAKYRALGRLYVGLQLMTLMGAGLVGLAALVTLGAPATTAEGQPVFAAAERIPTPGVAEPSGIAFHPTLEQLVPGRRRGLAGRARLRWARLAGGRRAGEPRGHHGPRPVRRAAAAGSERASELVVWDPGARRELRRIRLDRDGLLGRAAGDVNNGFEGVAFREQDGGGTLYLVHQRAPALVVAVAFDLARVGDTIGADAVTARWPVAGRGDLTDVSWAAEMGRLLVLADKKDRVMFLTPDGQVQAEVAVPGRQQEGVALGPDGSLWLADDQDKSVLKIEGALAIIEKQLAPDPASPPPRSSPASLVG